MRAKRIINEFITLKKKIDYIYYLWKEIASLHYLPQLVCLISYRKNVAQECKLLNILSFLIDFQQKNITYYLLSNTNNKWNSLMYISLISKIAKNSYYKRFRYE
jgi:hypothetical protein